MSEITDEARRIENRLSFRPGTLNRVDGILVTLIIAHVNTLPALGRADRTAIRAIVELGLLGHYEQARAFLDELTY